MNQELIQQTDQELKIAPESLEVAQAYMTTLDMNQTAHDLELPLEDVVHHLQKREVKKFIDAVFIDQGYMNRHKLQGAIDNLITKKLEELDEAEMGSSKDIADLLKLAVDYRNSEIKNMQAEEKIMAPLQQNNIQINAYGENYKNLMNSILTGELIK